MSAFWQKRIATIKLKLAHHRSLDVAAIGERAVEAGGAIVAPRLRPAIFPLPRSCGGGVTERSEASKRRCRPIRRAAGLGGRQVARDAPETPRGPSAGQTWLAMIASTWCGSGGSPARPRAPVSAAFERRFGDPTPWRRQANPRPRSAARARWRLGPTAPARAYGRRQRADCGHRGRGKIENERAWPL